MTDKPLSFNMSEVAIIAHIKENPSRS